MYLGVVNGDIIDSGGFFRPKEQGMGRQRGDEVVSTGMEGKTSCDMVKGIDLGPLLLMEGTVYLTLI